MRAVPHAVSYVVSVRTRARVRPGLPVVSSAASGLIARILSFASDWDAAISGDLFHQVRESFRIVLDQIQSLKKHLLEHVLVAQLRNPVPTPSRSSSKATSRSRLPPPAPTTTVAMLGYPIAPAPIATLAISRRRSAAPNLTEFAHAADHDTCGSDTAERGNEERLAERAGNHLLLDRTGNPVIQCGIYGANGIHRLNAAIVANDDDRRLDFGDVPEPHSNVERDRFTAPEDRRIAGAIGGALVTACASERVLVPSAAFTMASAAICSSSCVKPWGPPSCFALSAIRVSSSMSRRSAAER